LKIRYFALFCHPLTYIWIMCNIWLAWSDCDTSSRPASFTWKSWNAWWNLFYDG